MRAGATLVTPAVPHTLFGAEGTPPTYHIHPQWSNHMSNPEDYIRPSTIHIGVEATDLYDLERERDRFIDRCVKVWSKHLGYDKAEYWTRGMPQQLFDILEGHDSRASVLAAQAYLEYAKGAGICPDLFDGQVNA